MPTTNDPKGGATTAPQVTPKAQTESSKSPAPEKATETNPAAAAAALDLASPDSPAAAPKAEESEAEAAPKVPEGKPADKAADPKAKAPAKDAPKGEEKKADPEKKAAEAPAEPVYDLKLAETSLLDPDVDVQEVIDLAKAEKLTPDQAKKVLEQRERAVLGFKEHQAAAVAEGVNRWKGELPGDPEIGGHKLEAACEDARRFLQAFGDPEMAQILDQTGFGNNKHWIRMASRAWRKSGKADQLVDGKAVAPERSQADLIFGDDETHKVHAGETQ